MTLDDLPETIRPWGPTQYECDGLAQLNRQAQNHAVQQAANADLGQLLAGLGQYQGQGQSGILGNPYANAYRPPEQPKINGETFRQWNDRCNDRVAELDASGQSWPWVEAQNWKAEIDAWADLYGCVAA